MKSYPVGKVFNMACDILKTCWTSMQYHPLFLSEDIFYLNSVDPDEMPHDGAFHLGHGRIQRGDRGPGPPPPENSQK